MVLAGDRPLTWLKARLLPSDMDLQSGFDADLEAIGRPSPRRHKPRQTADDRQLLLPAPE
jgi:hypothetical protein